jgi:hypothetical protein
MLFLKNIFQSKIVQMLFVKTEKKILGRWNLESCDKKINNKIDLSNEDHCGPCGQYLLDKTTIDKPNTHVNKQQ